MGVDEPGGLVTIRSDGRCAGASGDRKPHGWQAQELTPTATKPRELQIKASTGAVERTVLPDL
jgi:hypothetical protein